MVCGASLPTTIVSYRVFVNVLKIEHFSILGNHLEIGVNMSKFRKSLKINVGQAKCRKVDMCFHEIKVLNLTSLVYISNWILSLNGVDCRDM